MAAPVPFPIVPRATALIRPAPGPRPASAGGDNVRRLPPRRLGLVALLPWSPEAQQAHHRLADLRAARDAGSARRRLTPRQSGMLLAFAAGAVWAGVMVLIVLAWAVLT